MDTERLPKHIRALSAAHQHAAGKDEPTLIQTHISWVILTDSHAYKIKKPVDFGFLNFTSLQRRKRACQDELRLNRRLAPDIYLDVLPVYREEGRFAIGEKGSRGEIVDYALKMLRFNQSDLFDRLLAEDHFDPAWMDRLAQTVADFHRSAERPAASASFGSPAKLQHHIQESLDVGTGHLEAPLMLNLERQSRAWLDSRREKLISRQAGGHIRDCHGDLHLKNIVLYHGVPTPFDCIEFSDELRMIDCMNDAAFLVMDCDARGRPDLGYRFLSRYLEYGGDYAGLALLPLYLSYRAGVRGKVACLLADDTSLTANEKQAQITEAEHYYRLAGSYLAPTSAKLFVVGGLSGSGKSHLALKAPHSERAVVIRSDATRKRIAGDHPALPLYGQQMHEMTYSAMFEAAETALTAGFPVILDATFLHAESREQTAELAKRTKVPLTFFWLDVDTQTLRQRVAARSGLNNDISDADLTVLDMQLKEYARPQEPFITFIQESDSWPAG